MIKKLTKTFRYLILGFSFLVAFPLQAEIPYQINYAQIELGAKVPYHNALLHAVLEASKGEYGPYQLNIISQAKEWTTARNVHYLAQGDVVNISWGGTGPGEPADIGVIRIEYPILKSINGYRIFLIDKAQQHQFKQITTRHDLQKYKAGQVSGWVEVKLLKHNELPLIDNSHLNNLYAMLAMGRYDYLPLGVLEISDEFEKVSKKHDNLLIDDSILLYYPSPIYYLVSEKKPELANRIRFGMKVITQDGTLDRLFEQHFSEVLNKYRLQDRQVITLENPYLPESYKLSTPELIQ